MNSMKTTSRRIAAPLTALTLLMAVPMGCPTWRTEHKVETTHKIEAHITLDIRQIQAEAAQVEGEVRDTPKAKPDGAPTSAVWGIGQAAVREVVVASRSLAGILDLSSSAHAQDDADEKDAIANRKARFAELDKALSAGCIGENEKGMIELRPCDDAKDAAKKSALDKLTKDENADRKIIYSAIAVRQGVKAEQYEAVGLVYASEIRKNLKSGQAFQVPTDTKLYTDFMATPHGKSLPNAKKGEWVKVP